MKKKKHVYKSTPIGRGKTLENNRVFLRRNRHTRRPSEDAELLDVFCYVLFIAGLFSGIIVGLATFFWCLSLTGGEFMKSLYFGPAWALIPFSSLYFNRRIKFMIKKIDF